MAYDRGLAGWVRVPHAQIHVIRRDRLLELAEQENLPLPERLPDVGDLVLLPEPHADTLANRAGAGGCSPATGKCCFTRGSTN